MRIQIDATPLLLRSAGVKNYFYYWLRFLRQAAGEDKIVAFPFLGRFGELVHERSVLGPIGTWPRLALLHFVNIPHNPAVDLMNFRADVFHVSNQIRNPPRWTPVTATIHDLTCWLMPELHTPANVLADRHYAEKALRPAAGLIAVSENTRRDAIRVLDLDPAKVEVIHPGVAETYFSASPDEGRRLGKRYGLAHPYILFVGTIEPRKNLDTLLNAYAGLPRSLKREVDLVVIGPPGWSAETTLRRLQAGEPGIHYLGYVPEADLPPLMAGATVFAYPSLYEGFGFPVVQAMACGTPVVTSNVSSLPEVTADAAVLIDPRSVAELRDAIARLVTAPGLRRDLAEKGRRRAGCFRWETCAGKSLAFFRAVTGK